MYVIVCAPLIIAIIVKILYEEKKMTQTEIARLLSISQSSVSRYLSRARGNTPLCPMDREWVEENLRILVDDIVAGKKDIDEVICYICRAWRFRAK